MDAVVGFDNTVKAGAWIPIAVTLTNDDAQDGQA
jgi:hypothetical protein